MANHIDSNNLLSLLDGFTLDNAEDIILEVAENFRRRRVEKNITRVQRVCFPSRGRMHRHCHGLLGNSTEFFIESQELIGRCARFADALRA